MAFKFKHSWCGNGAEFSNKTVWTLIEGSHFRAKLLSLGKLSRCGEMFAVIEVLKKKKLCIFSFYTRTPRDSAQGMVKLCGWSLQLHFRPILQDEFSEKNIITKSFFLISWCSIEREFLHEFSPRIVCQIKAFLKEKSHVNNGFETTTRNGSCDFVIWTIFY